MAWIQQHWFILLLLLGYTAMLAHHAWIGRRGTKELADYYVGGRSMGGITIGLSFFATYSSTNSFVGFAGQSYLYGTPWLLMAPAVVGFSLLAWLWVAPRLRHFTGSLGSLTIPDFIGFRFGSRTARTTAAIIVIFASILYVTAIFKGIANTLEAFLNLPYGTVIWIVFVIVVIYTAVGGFISVVKTDAVQGLIMVLAAALLFFGTVRRSGGLDSVFELADTDFGGHLFAWDAAMPLPVLLGIIFAATIKFIVEPRQLTRFYALKDKRAVRQGTWVSTFAFLIVYTMLVPIGLYAQNIFPGEFTDSDRIVPALLTDPSIFHPSLSGLVLLALIAGAMSSLDSVLLVMASTCHRDLLEPWTRNVTGYYAVRATRWYVVLFAFICTLIALDPPGSIVRLTAFSGSLYAACFFPPLIFGLYWRRGNGTAVTATFLAGVAVLLLWRPLGVWDGVHEVFPAILLSTLVFVGLTGLLKSKVPDEVEETFKSLKN